MLFRLFCMVSVCRLLLVVVLGRVMWYFSFWVFFCSFSVLLWVWFSIWFMLWFISVRMLWFLVRVCVNVFGVIILWKLVICVLELNGVVNLISWWFFMVVLVVKWCFMFIFSFWLLVWLLWMFWDDVLLGYRLLLCGLVCCCGGMFCFYMGLLVGLVCFRCLGLVVFSCLGLWCWLVWCWMWWW